MARQERKKSKTGIYHVMLRGINQQTIFEDEGDNQKFLQTLKDYQEKSGYIIYAYCLMGNHIHLLMKEGEEDLGIAFKRIGVSYVYWYNWKYERRGHLFQGRFKSEVVENDEYFQVVIRYIHQNPIRAGMVDNIGDYRWSSYNEYIISEHNRDKRSGLCEIDFPLDMLSSDRSQAIKMFKKYNNTENEDQCLDYDTVKRLRDSEAKDLIIGITGVESPIEIGKFDKAKRNQILLALKDSDISLRQLSRLTGVSLGVIRGAWS